MEESKTAALESGIDELIALCATLTRENRALREEQSTWRAERAKLIERNELAKSKIDAMIGRLRSLDEPAPDLPAGSGAGDHAVPGPVDLDARADRLPR